MTGPVHAGFLVAYKEAIIVPILEIFVMRTDVNVYADIRMESIVPIHTSVVLTMPHVHLVRVNCLAV